VVLLFGKNSFQIHSSPSLYLNAPILERKWLDLKENTGGITGKRGEWEWKIQGMTGKKVGKACPAPALEPIMPA